MLVQHRHHELDRPFEADAGLLVGDQRMILAGCELDERAHAVIARDDRCSAGSRSPDSRAAVRQTS